MKILKFLLILQIMNSFKSDKIIINPKNYKKNNPNILLIIIQGAFVPNYQYISLTEEITKNFENTNLWFGIPNFIEDMPNPLEINSKINEIYDFVRNVNFLENEDLVKNKRNSVEKMNKIYNFQRNNSGKNVKTSNLKNEIKKQNSQNLENLEVYLIAHSLGTVFLQDYLQKNEIGVKAAILMGGPILRKYRKIEENGLSSFIFDLPVLTIAGELDGLSGISRFGESFWHLRNLVKKENYEKKEKPEKDTKDLDNGEIIEKELFTNLEEAYLKFPHVYIEGMNHSQFANGYLSNTIKKNDLRSEISNEEATKKLGETISLFISQTKAENLNKKIKTEKNLLKKQKKKLLKKISETENFILPLINLLELSGNMNLKPACNGHELVNEKKANCFHGSKVGEMAQRIMSGFEDVENVEIETDDNFHLVYSVNPVHLPEILNFCEKNSKTENLQNKKIKKKAKKCLIKSITVSQPVNSTLDKLDGVTSNTAYEIRTKLSSRQNSFFHANLDFSDFSKLDEISTCGSINKKMLEIAMGSFNDKIKSRFELFGQRLVIGEDMGPYNAGPLWIWKQMSYEEVLGENGKIDVLVRAPMMRTPVDYFIKSAAGFHYCKILSPGYVAEWVYSLGLKKYYGIESTVKIM